MIVFSTLRRLWMRVERWGVFAMLSQESYAGIDRRLLVSYFFLALTVFADNGSFHPLLLIPLTVAFVQAIDAVINSRTRSAGGRLFSCLLILSWGMTFFRPPGFSENAVSAEAAGFSIPVPMALFLYFALTLAGLLVVLYGLLRKASRRQIWALLLLFFLAGALVIKGVPYPDIDVHWLQQAGARSLANGENPYGIVVPNLYSVEDTLMFFGDERSVLDAYPYPPVSLLVTIAGWLLAGDVRWAFLAAQLLCALFIWRMARKRGHSDRSALGLVGLWLLHPRGLFVIEMSWTEPLMCATWMGLILAMTGRPRSKPRAVVVAMGLFLSAKQNSIMVIPWLMERKWNKTILMGGVLAALACLPFVIWSLHDFLADVVLFQLRQPFRPDALGLPALIAMITGWQAPTWISLAAWAAGTSWILHRGKIRNESDTIRAWTFTAVTCYFMLFMLAKQAFCNYYYFVGLLMIAAAATGNPNEECESRDVMVHPSVLDARNKLDQLHGKLTT